jgi:hypothetical protein
VRLTLPAGTVGGWRWLGGRPKRPAVLHAPPRSIGLVLRVGVALDGELFFETPLGLAQPLRPRARNRLGLLGTALIQPLASLAQPALPALTRREDLGQLVAAPIPQDGGLRGVGGDRLFDDRASKLLIAHRLVAVGVGVHLRAVDSDHPHSRQTSVRAQAQDLAEHAGQRALVALDEPRERRVIRAPMRGNHATGDVVDARPLDRPRRPCAPRPAIQQQREHHRRLIGRATVAVLAIGGIERRRIHHRHSVDDEPRQVVLRQPLPNVGRQQERLLTIARQEVLRHARIVLNAPDSSSFVRQPRLKGAATAPISTASGGIGTSPLADDAVISTSSGGIETPRQSGTLRNVNRCLGEARSVEGFPACRL